MANWNKNDHRNAPHFDLYGFRRSELTSLAEKLGIDLTIPLENIKPSLPQDEKPLSAVDVELLKMEIETLKGVVRKLESARPILLNMYRDDDPLHLAIQIRNQEWLKYNPDNDRATRGNQSAIIRELELRGFSNAQAKAIELVACPIKRG